MKHVILKIIFCGLLSIITFSIQAQNKTVSGTVQDENNVPLPGVNILIKGTSQGTQSDFDGNYSLQASEGDLILFSYVGTKTIEKKIGAESTYDVVMESDSAELDEVVVVGYGTQKRKLTTGSVGSLDAENFAERPITRVDQGLIGQMAGVNVQQTSGMPGSPLSIRIRGTGSISAGNEPLYVIDGFPVETNGVNSNGNFSNGSPLDNINPNDIESIEVLKDAAAAAIYGSRASNGVVIVTTKKGKMGKPKFTLNTYGGISKEAKRVDMLNADEWIDRAKTMIDKQWMNSGIPGANVNQSIDQRREVFNQFQLQEGNDLLAPTEFNTSYMYDPRWDMEGYGDLNVIDWQDRIFRTGVFQNYQLSVSGATEDINYYVSGNYQKNEGYIINTDFEQFSARANITANITDKLSMGVNLAPSYSIKNDPGLEGKDNTLHKTLSTTPLMESTPNEAGELYTTRYDWGSSNTDPLPRLNRTGKGSMFRNLFTTFINYQIFNGLTLRSSFNFDNTDRTSESYLPNDNLESIRGGYGTYRKQNLVNENTLNYVNSFGNHNFNFLVGHSYNKYSITSSSLSSGNRYTRFGIYTLPDGSTGNTNSSKNVMISYFSRLQYDFQEKYLLSLSLRTDGSSKFGPENRWGLFPAISAGWRISEESFLKNSTWLSELKLRASYGINGSNNIGPYAWRSRLTSSNYVIGDSSVPGSGVGNIPNDAISWEESESINFGLDFGLLKGRITTTLNLYRKENSKLLLKVPAAQASGFSSYLDNIGRVRNDGIEFELTTYNIIQDNFQWKTSINASHNRNEVLALGPDQDRIEVTSGYSNIPFVLLEKGKPMYQIHTIQQDGVLTAQDIANGAATYGGGEPVLGDPKYVDQNGDGVITADDRVDIGSPFPKINWGITNTFKYKKFDLNILLQGQNGGKVISLLDRAINRTGMSSGENHLDVNPNVQGNWKTSFGYIVNSSWVYDSDYISLRNITLGFDMSEYFGERISGARIYATAENWLYWTDYSGFNPEATNAPASNDGRFPVPADYGGAPIAKTLIVGLNFNF
ncbi:SusC/RagA family TonB-linked outer membrane protein [Mesonia aestuariivivens]|uniref:TonB-dependent receptor n=1 Tax=Mesonia aestuariivivens TaxID=2796128 RepID=A0ABS6W435_9FLAO|nr:TonB-dependent receptor [Mesonia aestuariivivens]MBW2962628.1 TonB-dependent receptor [Mesonia aestuariivivens]